ncbi:hypothetical protein JCM10450v2_005973 [Rhodotorula kratochvilovae]
MRSALLLVALTTLASLASAAPLACGARQYLDAASQKCKLCPSSMMGCTSVTTALSCARGFYLTADQRCVTASKCPQNTFADSSKQACTRCYVTDAATCKDATVSGTTSCMTSCFTGSTCTPAVRLPAGFYCPNHVKTTCPGDGVSKCDPAGKATACKTGYSLNSQAGTCGKWTGQCELTCPNLIEIPVSVGKSWYSPKYPTDDGLTCEFCQIDGAYSCGPGPVATACMTDWGHHLYDGACVSCYGDETYDADSGTCLLHCTDGSLSTAVDGTVTVTRATYADRPTRTCKQCNDEGATSCSPSGVSSACLSGWNLSADNVCVKCLGEQTFNAQKRECELGCPHLVQTPVPGSTWTSITSPKYPSDDGLTCKTCEIDGAYSCGAGPVATACMTDWGYELHEGRCTSCLGDEKYDDAIHACALHCVGGSLSTATDGSVTVTRATYPDNASRTCKKCNDEGAASCSSKGVSSACLTGWNLSADNVCVKCADGQVFDAATRTCATPCRPAHYVTTSGGDRTLVPATVYNPDTLTCTACPDNAWSCKPDGTILYCYDSYNDPRREACVGGCVGDTTTVVDAPAGAVGFDFFGFCDYTREY